MTQNNPNPIDTSNVGRLVLGGTVVGLITIGIFVALWFGLEALGVDILFRLVISVCLPPALLFIIFGLYVIFRRPQPTDTEG